MSKKDKWIWGAIGIGSVVWLATRKGTSMDGIGAFDRATQRYRETGIAGVGAFDRATQRYRQTGIAGMGESAARTPEIVGSVNADWAAGKPGTYKIRMRAPQVPLSSPQTAYLDTKPFNDRLRAAGVDGTVTEVHYVGNENLGSSNWAQDIIDDVLSSSGTGSGTTRAISDRIYEFTVRINSSQKTNGMSGMGALPAIAVTAIALTVCAAVLAGIVVIGGNVIIERITKLFTDVPPALGGGVLVVAAAVAAGIFLLRKSGARVRTKGFSF